MTTPIDRKKARMGYLNISLTGRSCRVCTYAQAQADTGRLNCIKGGFWVAPVGRCDKFEPVAAKAPEGI